MHECAAEYVLHELCIREAKAMSPRLTFDAAKCLSLETDVEQSLPRLEIGLRYQASDNHSTALCLVFSSAVFPLSHVQKAVLNQQSTLELIKQAA